MQYSLSFDDYEKILNTEFQSYDIGSVTVRQYLKCLLETLWNEGEGFSGKRPFGNSGWNYDLYKGLVKSGYINGGFDDNGYLEINNTAISKADELVFELIDYIFELD